MRFTAVATFLILSLPLSAPAQSKPSDEVPISFVAHMKTQMAPSKSANDGGGFLGNRSNGSTLGVDSIPNFSSYFYYPGFDSFGGMQYTWPYTMVGNSPFLRNDTSRGDDDNFTGATTWIGGPLIPVNLDLRDAKGNPRYINGKRLYSDATQFVQPVLKSPVYSDAVYDSSEKPTQFMDAVQRAEFFHTSSDDWHTELRPRVGRPRTMVLKQGTYVYALNADGTCCAFVLIDQNAFGQALFPATPTDASTPVGAAEVSGDIKTKDISSFLFNNAFLYANGDPRQCCILGYHTYDVEPGSEANGNREKRYVLDYASWISPGLFADTTFGDVTALSHELSEIFNDPFVNNATPWWIAPSGHCQNNLEDGDVTEGVQNAQYPVSINGYTYHPQNEALLQWFAGVEPSSAIHKAYSYPDTRVLTDESVSMKPGCKP